MDAAAGGAFLSLTISQATTLVEKMASNQGWSEERTQTRKRGGGIHQLKEVDMLAAKMDLLWKYLTREPLRRKKSCTSMILAWLVKSVDKLGTQLPTTQSGGRTWTTSTTTTTTTTVHNRIKARTSNSGLTTQVTTCWRLLTIKIICQLRRRKGIKTKHHHRLRVFTDNFHELWWMSISVGGYWNKNKRRSTCQIYIERRPERQL